MATGDSIARQRGITYSVCLGQSRPFFFQRKWSKIPYQFLPNRQPGRQAAANESRGETEAETGCHDCERPPWPPLAPSPILDEGCLGTTVPQQEHTQAGCGRWRFALGQAPGTWFLQKPRKGKSAEGISLRSGMTQSPEGWIQKIKRLQFFIWLSQNEKPSTYSLGALFPYSNVSQNATLWETLILNK